MKARQRSMVEEIEEEEEPSKRKRRIRGMGFVVILCFLIKEESMKQWVEPESRRQETSEILRGRRETQ